MRIAYYAPLKAPDHPTPSGDRYMARLLIQALDAAGHDVELASELRSFDGIGDRRRQEAIRAAAKAETARLIRSFEIGPSPDLWFTYHLYHKAPDWLGPEIATHFAIPYAIAEASFAPKRAGGPWDLGHRRAAEAIHAADRVLCLTRLDMACVEPLLKPSARLVYLPPFIDVEPFASVRRDRATIARRFNLDPARKWLLSVAMMRPGDKLASFTELAAALAKLAGRDWQLLLVGAGEAERDVRDLYAPFADAVRFAGKQDEMVLRQIYRACDLYLWPGVGEAYGMAYLEAQAGGLPVIAGNRRGVPDVVVDGVGGILVAPGDAGAFATAVRDLLDDDEKRAAFSRAAERFVRGERQLTSAAARLGEALA
jgi:glycosyltransferase involved in cell wall biosynthesis